LKPATYSLTTRGNNNLHRSVDWSLSPPNRPPYAANSSRAARFGDAKRDFFLTTFSAAGPRQLDGRRSGDPQPRRYFYWTFDATPAALRDVRNESAHSARRWSRSLTSWVAAL
jgi:hypothetical protein